MTLGARVSETVARLVMLVEIGSECKSSTTWVTLVDVLLLCAMFSSVAGEMSSKITIMSAIESTILLFAENNKVEIVFDVFLERSGFVRDGDSGTFGSEIQASGPWPGAKIGETFLWKILKDVSLMCSRTRLWPSRLRFRNKVLEQLLCVKDSLLATETRNQTDHPP